MRACPKELTCAVTSGATVVSGSEAPPPPSIEVLQDACVYSSTSSRSRLASCVVASRTCPHGCFWSCYGLSGTSVLPMEELGMPERFAVSTALCLVCLNLLDRGRTESPPALQAEPEAER